MAEAAGSDIDQPRSRLFGLADAMILIVALALSLALAGPAILIIADAIRSDPRWRFQTLDGAVSLARMLNIVVLNFLFFLIPACLILRLKRPRPPLRSMIGQPGFAACAAPFLLFLACLPLTWLPPSRLTGPLYIAVQVLLASASTLAWIALIATRRWAPEPSWIDRLGRVLGVLWMTSLPAHLVLIRLLF